MCAMARLRRSDVSKPGITRERRGKGFVYHDPSGTTIDAPEELARFSDLGIPPAWKDVWICPWPNGHLQATGTDVAGRKQYRYHPQWSARRAQEKFDDMVRFAHKLPDLRKRVAADLAMTDRPTRERVLACAVRLLDRGFFRIGGEEYAVDNESYGLATMRKEHVRVDAHDVMIFDYPAKHGIRRVQAVVDPEVVATITTLRRRRGGGPELLAYREGTVWKDIRSPDINDYLKEATGDDFSAKDFRTWNATVLASVALAVSGEVAATATGRKRAIVRAVKEVAHYLGNTPAVARSSYIDPRVFDAYNAGLIIRPALEEVATDTEDPSELPIHHSAVERAVLDLLSERSSSPALERVAA